MYSYKLMSLFSLTIFISVMLFYYVMMILTDDYSIFAETDLYIYVSTILGSFGVFADFVFPLVVFGAFVLVISNFILYFRGSKSLSNLAGIGIGAGLILLTMLGNNILEILEGFNLDVYSAPWYYLVLFFENSVFIIVAYIECMLIGSFICTIRAARHMPKRDKDYLIILGCYSGDGVTLPNILRNRVEKAFSFSSVQLNENDLALTFIPSGGQGKDESVSEAEAIKRYLIKKGINDERIISEEKSKNTRQNFKYSKELIKKNDAKVAFATTGYHVFRSGVLARQAGLHAEGIGARTKWYFYIPASIREFVAEIVSEKWRHVFNIVLINLVVISLLVFSYCNNI